MIRPSPKCNPEGQHGVRLEYVLSTSGSAAVVLFLFLSPTLVCPQAAVRVKPSSPALDRYFFT
jgi:hypothetical protein